MQEHKWVGLILTVMFLGLASPGVATAQETAPGQVAVILILDNSGSMRTSDPDDLRFTAARLFVALLDEGDAAGLIVFSTGSRPLTQGLVVIGHAGQKRDLVRQMSPAPAEGATDVKAGHQLRRRPGQPGRRPL